MEELIKIRGAREHNLKNIDLDLPKKRLVVFTGLSGSGKSSLAFDTIYAEGQRRYVESLSSYARQFLGVMDKPDLDLIEGLSPAISIDQKSTSRNPRSTVGTVTEIYDYLRLLFARIGHPHCPLCGREIASMSSQQISEQVVRLAKTDLEERRLSFVYILSPVVRDKKGEFKAIFDTLRQKGFTRARVDRRYIKLDESLGLIKTNKHSVEAVIDRISLDKKLLSDSVSFSSVRSRITDAIDQALSLSSGLCVASFITDSGFSMPEKPVGWTDHLFSEKFSCPVDNISLPEIEPRVFSFNSPHGACGKCTGLGLLLKIDPQRLINSELSLSEGGILPLGDMFERDTWNSRIVLAFCQEYGVDLRSPIKNIDGESLNKLLHGTGGQIYKVVGKNREGRSVTISERYDGVVPDLEKRYSQTESEFVRGEIEKYMKKEVCPECEGKRLKKEALGVTIFSKSINDITSLSIAEASRWVADLIKEGVLSGRETLIAKPILKELSLRLDFLNSVGLDYLTLGREAATLAGGEAQRIRLASQIGSGLSGVLYVLDEPSIGLHQRDNKRLISTLKRLRDLGNTVIVVEHDRETIENADWIVDFGPGAGEHGGRVVFEGSYEQILKSKESLTGKYLSGRKRILTNGATQTSGGNHRQGRLFLTGASGHNLKSIDLKIPLGNLVCITGVSGSGKSTLLVDTLYHALAGSFNKYHKETPAPYKRLFAVDDSGVERPADECVDKVILIDQSPIGRTPRSNPATYTGLFTPVRDLFASSAEARIRGYKAGRFSFNVKGGRCEVCEGEGQIKIEMQFLPDVYIDCEVCKGKRYNDETLEVTHRGQNIAEVLGMTVEESLDFFSNHTQIHSKLKTLEDVGLSYIHLGQPAPTLSGGEAQRVKLSTELTKRATGKTVYLLDEPTTGLHFADLEKLLFVLHRLAKAGNTVVVIEHNLDVVKNADWVIDLGPEGGERGGSIVVQGSPRTVAENPNSHTGNFLRALLN